jgi:hypothetical protein
MCTCASSSLVSPVRSFPNKMATLGVRVQGSGFRVQGSGFRVKGEG